MFAAIHPLLLWGALVVAAPIIIHLLLRQRPKPRPWAAMRWLVAAIRVAQRRYKLTNLLLLILRCLILLLIALAVVRPSLAGLGQGRRLVLVIDDTASMGPRGRDPGPLAEAVSALSGAHLPDRVSVLTVSDRVREIADGSAKDAIAALTRLHPAPVPGGIDLAMADNGLDRIEHAISPQTALVLISDFQQDDGRLVADALRPRCERLVRWQVGHPADNALITGLGPMPDLVPGAPGELVIHVAGTVDGVRMACDGGMPTPALTSVGGNEIRLALPPLTPGDHLLTVNLDDHGLAYDNSLELPLRVRTAVPVLIVSDHVDYLTAALAADVQELSAEHIRPIRFAIQALPHEGLVALRGRIGDGARLTRWVDAGGVLWASLDLLQADPSLSGLVQGIIPGKALAPGGRFQTGQSDLDGPMHIGGIAHPLPTWSFPPGTEILLRAGASPLVVTVPAGLGHVVVELAKDADLAALEARGTTPLWVRRVARDLTARPGQPRIWEAGTPAPAGVVLRRAGEVFTIKAGAPLMISPGLWQAQPGTPVVVLANRHEGRIDIPQRPGTVASVSEALPPPAGADWGLPLLIAALLVLICEGLIAAWAGRTYGR